MILSDRLKEEIRKITPTSRELSHAEVEYLEAQHEAKPKGFAGGLRRDIFFSSEKGLRYNYAQPEENSRFSVVGRLPLLVVWNMVNITGKLATFQSRLKFSKAEENFDYYMSHLWSEETVIKTLYENTVLVKAPPWLPPTSFICFVSEYQDLVAPYIRDTTSLY